TDAPNPCPAAPTTTFYVNATTGNDSNTGAGPACAFKTITAALTASNDMTHANATISVAAGTYGVNEVFPLVFNHGRSLVGAGASTTKIQGSSASFNTSNTNSMLDGLGADGGVSTHFFVTLLVGDILGGPNSLTATTVSGVTVLPASNVTVPTTNYLGMVCLAGNGPNTNLTPPLPAPNLIVKGVTVGPNFDYDVVLGSSPTQQTACNAAITTSTFAAANAGILTGACGAANPNLSWPSSQIGDGQVGDANTFTGTGIGVFIAGCGSMQSLSTNHFTSGFRGIVAVSQPAQYVEILGNTFDGTTAPFMGIGIQTNPVAVFSKLNDNTFANISESSAADTAVGETTGYALKLGGGHVLQAQRNTISNNDNGIYISGTMAANFDFSADGNPVNRNQFYCNSKTLAGNGYDVVLACGAGNVANFTGNQWDHGGPTTSVSLSTSPNGTDIATGASSGANTTSFGALISTACAAGRVH
ncbi:MAG TPA: hypothetical protein VF316_01415, partial [Polyangiaceae bacterium]